MQLLGLHIYMTLCMPGIFYATFSLEIGSKNRSISKSIVCTMPPKPIIAPISPVLWMTRY